MLTVVLASFLCGFSILGFEVIGSFIVSKFLNWTSFEISILSDLFHTFSLASGKIANCVSNFKMFLCGFSVNILMMGFSHSYWIQI